MKSLHDRVVVITGAASGIGRATAAAFGRRGARLQLVDIDGQRLEAAAAELRAAGMQVTTYVVDCRDAAAMEQLARDVYVRHGRTDVLHNNAGTCLGGPVTELTLDDWRWQLDINLWGVIHGVQAFVPRMIAQGGGGHIVNTASMAGLVGLPFVAPYCASKFAVVGLSEALAAELAPHDIRVTTVCPAAVRSRVMRDARLRLPGAWHERIARGFEWWAADPAALAEQIVAAVRSERRLVVAAREMAPLWWLKRLSIRAYQQVAATLTCQAVQPGAALQRVARLIQRISGTPANMTNSVETAPNFRYSQKPRV